MNNPYRARPATRSRIDHNLGYGVRNQNVWNPAVRAQTDVPSNDSIQRQPSIVNQSKQAADPWNNSWNWDFDKQTDNQQQQQQQQPQQPQHQQQQQQQPQQQHYVPPYASQGHLIPNSVQDHYYQNANGNKSDMLNQNSDRNTPGIPTNRPPASHQPDSFPYFNYNQNQQYPPPPRPSSAKTNSMSFDHSQWPNEQTQNAPYAQQRGVPQNQKDQASHPPLPGNNYNWNKLDQSSTAPHNWQNHGNVPGHWHDTSIDKEVLRLDDLENQCASPSQNPTMQVLTPPNDGVNKEHSMNWSNGKQGSSDINDWSNQNNAMPSQWMQNHESMIPGQSHQSAHNYNVDTELNSWGQPMNTEQSRQWKHTNDLHAAQWMHKPKGDSNIQEENKPQEKSGAASLEDWSQNRGASSHYSLPNIPITAESSTDHEERKKSVPSLIPNPVPPKDSSGQGKASSVKPHILDPYHKAPAPSETISHATSENVLPVQENNDFNLTPDKPDWPRKDTADELPAKLDQLSLGTKYNKRLESQEESLEAHAPVPGDGWGQDTASSFSINATPDNIPVLPSDYPAANSDNSHSIDNQVPVAQEHPAVSTYQSNVQLTDNVTQGGYDQWYNQNAMPMSPENTWYSQDQVRPAKQWSAEQNVENYENIQQPSEFVNLEVVTPSLQQRDIYGSRESINKETLDNDPKPVLNTVKEARDFRQEVNNMEVPSQPRSHPPLQAEQVPDNYEFASNDRNTFLETGELTDSHQEHEPTPPSQDDENDEVPNDIPFLREVPGQSSSIDPRRNDPTGQEHYVQPAPRLPDPRRNDPSGQEQSLQLRSISDRSERRDVPPGQERSLPLLSRSDSDTLERRNDPSGRERSLPPQVSRNDPSGEERYQSQSQIMLEPGETREVPGRGNEPEESAQQVDDDLRQIPGGASPNEAMQSNDDRPNGRVVTGSQEVPSVSSVMSDQTSESRSKREEAVGAPVINGQAVPVTSARRDSYEDEDDEGSGNSRDGSRERRRDSSPERRRYDFERKGPYYDRNREYDDDYYYERRRGAETDRPYPRDDFDRRDVPFRDDDRKHSRDDLDRHSREELDRRNRGKDELDERDGRRRPDDRRRTDDVRRRDRDYDPRYPRDGRDYLDRERRRDDRRPRRYDDYDIRDPYRREYYDDPYSRGSRPSSRSSYNDRDREYYMRTRDPYYGYNGYGGYDYGTHYGSTYYAYLENLRRTNPAAYSEWYHKYYASQHQQQHMARGVANYPEDRASVHSGRSSCDERTTTDKRTLGDISLLEDSAAASARMTPTKFSTSHAYGCFSIGSLVHTYASYPADGERAKVDVFRMDSLLMHDPVARDLRAYPGPLIKQVGVTHKKTIIEYCENKIKKAATNEEMVDRASYILLYELMILLIQQNGNVVGVDIAALLLRNKDAYPYEANKPKSQDRGRRESVISQRSEATGGDTNAQDSTAVSEKPESNKPRKTIEQITDEFRNTLLYGLVQEALEYAMNEGLWGHALFLASKLDKRTHASVMTRFANSLPHHDPLQTLYQLHSGRVPSVVTCVSDPRWDDWRPHLAMIISNTSANPEVNRRSITTLGDTLYARGDIHAAHFCYILAQIDFGAYGANNVKLVLIGTNHHKPYSEFLTTEAVMLTEIYEYARNLSEPGFTLVDLQSFKFDLAVKMVDYGLIEKALLYIEQIAVNVVNEPSKYKKSFIDAVYTVGDRIKYHDPVYKDSTDDATPLIWLTNLAEIVGKCQTGEIVENDIYASQMKTDSHNHTQAQDVHELKQPRQQQWNTGMDMGYTEGPTSMLEINTNEMQSEWQPLSLPSNMQDTYDQNAQYMRNNDESYQQPQQQEYWNQESYCQNNYARNECTPSNWQQEQQPNHPGYPDQPSADNSQQQEKWNYEAEREEKTPTPEPSQPAISMTPSMRKQYDPLEELDALETPKTATKPATATRKGTEKTTDKKPSNSGGSWFGGLFSKLTPKPKNQMILPDDNNPAIVWDPVAKKWMNKDEDGDNGSGTIAPPPKASDMGFRPPTVEQIPPPNPEPSVQANEPPPPGNAAIPKPMPGGSNMFKLPKGRSMRANYIDVMNPNGTKSSAASSNIPTPVTSPLVPMATSSPQLFVPAPVNDPSAPVDFLTPTSTPVASSTNLSENASQGLSRWSSTSSLSREVQSYTMRDPRLLLRNKGPMMYNPNDMKDRSAKSVPQQPGRYPPR